MMPMQINCVPLNSEISTISVAQPDGKAYEKRYAVHTVNRSGGSNRVEVQADLTHVRNLRNL